MEKEIIAEKLIGGMVAVAELKKVLISLSDELLNEIDYYAKSGGGTRSEWIREAMKEYIAKRKTLELEESLKKGYQLMSAINLEWANDCFQADNMLCFEMEQKLSECE